MTFNAIKRLAVDSGLPLHEAALVADMTESGNNPEETRAQLSEFLRVILEESEKQYGKAQDTLTGLTGTNAKKAHDRGVLYHSRFTHVAIVASLSICESNASMGRVVACPTAGASGVIPGIFYALSKENAFPFAHLLPGFILASAIGNVIAAKATLSGAAGGCQAEIGSAAAMGAGALAYLSGGDAETVDAMRRVGQTLPMELRETGLGGLAATRTAKQLVDRIQTRFQKP